MSDSILKSWFPSSGDFVPVIAGPCGAESRTQVMATADRLAALGRVGVFRSGVWKPRTRPGGFEGKGDPALAWLCEAREKTGLRLIVEVATKGHVAACLDAGIDMVWVGARTCANPFSVQEIADALSGHDIPVLVKNPLYPDIDLWAGAIERFRKAGMKQLAGILRGVYPFGPCAYRNEPRWDMAIELRLQFPGLPVLCDPSHMAGDAALVPGLCQKALDLHMDGLMIESHISPETALCDAGQQLTPEALGRVFDTLVPRRETSDDTRFVEKLQTLRRAIDDLDRQVLALLGKRGQLVEKIGREKIRQNIAILQIQRWKTIQQTRQKAAAARGLSPEFAKKLFDLIHEESIAVQTRVMQVHAGQDPDQRNQ
jgi:chorismate mutase